MPPLESTSVSGMIQTVFNTTENFSTWFWPSILFTTFINIAVTIIVYHQIMFLFWSSVAFNDLVKLSLLWFCYHKVGHLILMFKIKESVFCVSSFFFNQISFPGNMQINIHMKKEVLTGNEQNCISLISLHCLQIFVIIITGLCQKLFPMEWWVGATYS